MQRGGQTTIISKVEFFKNIGTPAWFEIDWWAPEDSVSHGCVRKVGRSVKAVKVKEKEDEYHKGLFLKINRNHP